MTLFDAPKSRRLCAEEADSQPQMPEATAPPGPKGPESVVGPDGPSPKHRKRARIPCTNLSTAPRPTRSGPPGSGNGLTPLLGTRNLFGTRWPESPIGRRTAAKGNPSAEASPLQLNEMREAHRTAVPARPPPAGNRRAGPEGLSPTARLTVGINPGRRGRLSIIDSYPRARSDAAPRTPRGRGGAARVRVGGPHRH